MSVILSTQYQRVYQTEESRPSDGLRNIETLNSRSCSEYASYGEVLLLLVLLFAAVPERRLPRRMPLR